MIGNRSVLTNMNMEELTIINFCQKLIVVDNDSINNKVEIMLLLLTLLVQIKTIIRFHLPTIKVLLIQLIISRLHKVEKIIWILPTGYSCLYFIGAVYSWL